MKTFAILGAGTWGTALGNMLENMGHHVAIWSPDDAEVEKLITKRIHKHLPDSPINTYIEFSTDLEGVLFSKDYVIVATPSIYVRNTLETAKPYIKKDQVIISVSKGIEKDTMLTMSEVIHDVLGNNFKVAALSGPTHAEEVAKGLPTLIAACCEHEETAKKIRDDINNEVLRVYSNTDIKGAEVAGALKNIIALAAGMSEGMGFGDNAKAALITRGLAEMTRLGLAMGCRKETFYGLTGIGDIVVTATSHYSRNHNAGVLLGQGKSLNATLKKIGMVVEGINALVAAKELSVKYNVELPIVNAVYSVVYEKISPKDAVIALFNRKLTSE